MIRHTRIRLAHYDIAQLTVQYHIVRGYIENTTNSCIRVHRLVGGLTIHSEIDIDVYYKGNLLERYLTRCKVKRTVKSLRKYHDIDISVLWDI